MHKCPKCSSLYGDDVKICRTCGAILEAVLEESPQVNDLSPHEDDKAHEATPTDEPSWTCLQCSQSVPGSFEVCWNCGTSQDGIPDLDFSKEPASDNHLKKWQPSEPAVAKKIGYPCPRCGSSKTIPNTRILDQGCDSDGKLQVSVDACPDALIFKDCLYDQLTADICGDCGHVELKVAHPRELYEHYLQSRAGQGRE
jgi:hypothetical protein